MEASEVQLGSENGPFAEVDYSDIPISSVTLFMIYTDSANSGTLPVIKSGILTTDYAMNITFTVSYEANVRVI